jgi:hypothetical protein
MSTVLFVLHINGLATGQFGRLRVNASNGETNEEKNKNNTKIQNKNTTKIQNKNNTKI